MCGIFGLVATHGSPLRDTARSKACLDQLFELSESRGKEAAGLALANEGSLFVAKAAIPASQFIKSSAYRGILKEGVNGVPANGARSAVAIIGHSRLVTNGASELNLNNQPVLSSGVLGVHNGIIVNDLQLFASHGLDRKYDVDSEVIFALLRKNLNAGASPARAVASTFSELKGAASVAALFDDRDELIVATNNGSLYYALSRDGKGLLFASERYILHRLLESSELSQHFDVHSLEHLRPGSGLLADLSDFGVHRFDFDGAAAATGRARREPRRLVDRSAPDKKPKISEREARRREEIARAKELFPFRAPDLRRCSTCILPETMPFIRFDERGVCSYCRTYRKPPLRGREALEQLVAPHRRGDDRPDCVAGLSGGRDSTFGLHYLKTQLGLNPIAYTYDWGMVTDLARRNISRICGKLGVEHILVSADIGRKRAYIRKNVEAWLHRPSLGTIPLFMAGDKAYFHHLRQVRAQTGVELSFLCENLLERTDFKAGFAGVPPEFGDEDHVYTMPVFNKLRLLKFYATEFLTNPRYLNSSLIDSALAFRFYYTGRRDYQNLYRYIQWDEQTVESTLIGEYDFELAEDTRTTWRIGDGTAAFYNYIYRTVAGFNEHDTFRSNQIREGVITREEGLRLVDRDAQPRFESISWYLETIGTDRSLEQVLRIINSIPKLY